MDGYHGYWALDINATRDTAIHAAGPGQVEVAVADQGGNCDFVLHGHDKNCPDVSRGNLVRIKHDANGDVTTFYLHSSRVFVETADWVVDRGAAIFGPATLFSTGAITVQRDRSAPVGP